ncbi:MAG: amino acid ABC transporter ATP-binding protein [Erysipelothrix sp.]|nr:amino acid ABC transporter ATP-binding protein [Erysipelothrix sp.]
MSLLSIQNLSKSYDDLVVLRDINLNVAPGEIVTLIGASGSGKSTLLRCINKLEQYNAGSITFNNQNIDDRDVNIEEYRSNVGIIFQSFNLFNNLSVLENCVIGPVRVLKRPRAEVMAEATENLRRVGMLDFINSNPKQLSGGQKQRVAIARALTMQPKLLLLDEPTSALDPEAVDDVLNIIRELASEDFTMLIVTHEMSFAKDVSDRIVFMDEGLIVEEGTPEHIFNQPTQERTQAFLSRFINQ